MLTIALNPIINNKKHQKTIKMFLFFLFHFNKKILDFHLIIKTTVKKYVLFIRIKILIDFEMIINFVFQLLIKKLENLKNESNEHQILISNEQRLRTFQLHDFEINMTNNDDKNVTIKTKLLNSDIIKFDLLLEMP